MSKKCPMQSCCLPSHGVTDTIEAQARDTVNEGAQKRATNGKNAASRLIRVTEHYVRMDYEGNGIRPTKTGVNALMPGSIA